jgi:hypothetical protein
MKSSTTESVGCAVRTNAGDERAVRTAHPTKPDRFRLSSSQTQHWDIAMKTAQGYNQEARA